MPSEKAIRGRSDKIVFERGRERENKNKNDRSTEAPKRKIGVKVKGDV